MNEFLNYKFENFVKSLSPHADKNYSLWAATKYLKRPKQLKFPIKKADNTWAETDLEKAERLADHFEMAFQPHNDIAAPSSDSENESSTDNRDSEPHSLREVSSLKTRKSRKIPPV